MGQSKGAEEGKADAAASQATPFGVSRYFILVVYVLVLTIVGFPVGAADPMQQLLKINGAYAELGPLEQQNTITQIMSVGFSAFLLSGLVIGPIVDLVGPKVSGLLGCSVHSFAWYALFFTESKPLHVTSMLMFGLGFQLVINAFVSVAALFQGNSNLVFTLLTGGPDINLLLPQTMLWWVTRAAFPELPLAADVKRIILLFLTSLVLPSIAAVFVFVPVKPFVESGEEKSDFDPASVTATDERYPILGDASPADVEKAELAAASEGDAVNLHELSLAQQIMTADFWVFAISFVVIFCRKKHFAVSIRPILEEAGIAAGHGTGPADAVVSMYNNYVPYGFLTALGWGALADRLGLMPTMFISNLLGVVVSFGISSSAVWVQRVMVILFIVQQSYVFGQILNFCGTWFGMRTLSAMQGVLCAFVGLSSLVMDLFWPSFVTHTLQSYAKANGIVGFAGCALFASLFFLSHKQRRRNAAVEAATLANTGTINANIYERTSLSVLQNDIKKTVSATRIAAAQS